MEVSLRRPDSCLAGSGRTCGGFGHCWRCSSSLGQWLLSPFHTSSRLIRGQTCAVPFCWYSRLEPAMESPPSVLDWESRRSALRSTLPLRWEPQPPSVRQFHSFGYTRPPFLRVRDLSLKLA